MEWIQTTKPSQSQSHKLQDRNKYILHLVFAHNILQSTLGETLEDTFNKDDDDDNMVDADLREKVMASEDDRSHEDGEEPKACNVTIQTGSGNSIFE